MAQKTDKDATKAKRTPHRAKIKDAPLPKRMPNRPASLYHRVVIISALGVYADALVAQNKATYTLTESLAGVSVEDYIPI